MAIVSPARHVGEDKSFAAIPNTATSFSPYSPRRCVLRHQLANAGDVKPLFARLSQSWVTSPAFSIP
ncbi:hypothetical protein KCP75_18060 [Salmonella enterica subsp. enterica]|nr:hypothetical protein KCP75_18060 [Salmonella enterica subsp. enterica]